AHPSEPAEVRTSPKGPAASSPSVSPAPARPETRVAPPASEDESARTERKRADQESLRRDLRNRQITQACANANIGDPEGYRRCVQNSIRQP
ncbi:MAG: hypothetical protein M3O15_09335, partial [Acidobacteriota bacterium]|nr:hypothetical protein [Acidobacteriota bacterium]